MKHLFSILFFSLALIVSVYAQGVAIGTGSITPDTSAMLELRTTSKGFLPPRMTTAQRTAIALPAQGLLVYDTDLNSLMGYNGTAWSAIGSGTETDPKVGATAVNNIPKWNGSTLVNSAITDNGNVGIGTENPQHPLEVFSPSIVATNQQQLNKSHHIWLIDDYAIRQTFTPTISGELASIKIWVAFNTYLTAFNLALNVYAGDQLYASSLPLPIGTASQLVPGNSIDREVGFTFTVPPVLTSGTTYTMSITALIPISFTSAFYLSSNNNYSDYANGDAVLYQTSINAVHQNFFDIAFSTTMKGPGSSFWIDNLGVAQSVELHTSELRNKALQGAGVRLVLADAQGRLVSPESTNLSYIGIGGLPLSMGHWTSDYPTRFLGVTDGSAHVAGFEIENTASGGLFSQKLHLRTHHYGGTYGRRFTIDEDGNVGIGTETPGAKLEVNGQVKITGGTPGAGKVLTSDATGAATWEAPALTVSGSTLSIAGGNSVALPDDSPTNELQNLNISANSLSISSGNSVSLAPYLDNTDGQTLSLSGNNLSIAGGNSVTLPGSTDNLGNHTATQDLQLGGNMLMMGDWLTNYPTRFVGVTNGTVKTAGMEIENTTLGGNYSQKLHLLSHTYGASLGRRLTIDEGGNVGIGIETPGAKLEIAGQVKITGGSPGASRVLASDATGLATWNNVTDLVSFSNGLATTAPNAVGLGGSLAGNTSIGLAGHNLTFSGAGNVGIGASSPTTTFQVGESQSSPIAAISVAASSASLDAIYGQVFTPSSNCMVTGITVYMAGVPGNSGTAWIKLCNGAVTSSTGAIATSNSTAFPSTLVSAITCTFPAPVPVAAGQPYTFFVESSIGGATTYIAEGVGAGGVVSGIGVAPNRALQFEVFGNTLALTIDNVARQTTLYTPLTVKGIFSANANAIVSGNLGIGTATPANKLEVASAGSTTNGGSIAAFGSGSSSNAGELYGIGISKYGVDALIMGINKNTSTGTVPSNAIYISTYSSASGISLGRGGNNGLPSTSDIYVAGDGDVGLGTTTPLAPLHVARKTGNVPGGTFPTFDGAGFHYSSSGINASQDGTITNVAVIVDGNLVASEGVYAHNNAVNSDARIKRVLRTSNAAQDLADLMRIRIADYQYIDTIMHGNAVVKKVVAQEVETVLPNAVSKRAGFIPDMYAPAQVLAATDSTLQLAWTKGEAIPTGTKIKCFINGEIEWHGEMVKYEHNILTLKGVQLPAEVKGAFAYGREVPDFRAVDYDALAMLNLSATQELVRQIEDLKAQQQAMQMQHHAEKAQQTAAMDQLRAQVEGLAKAVLQYGQH